MSWKGSFAALATGLGLLVPPALAQGPDFQPVVIDGVPVQWPRAAAGGATLLKYAIARGETDTPNAINCGRLRAPDTLLATSNVDQTAFRSAAREAFARWQHVAGLVFVEVADEASADIVLGEQADPQGHAFTNLTLGTTSEKGVRPIQKALMCLNPKKHWKIGFDGNLAVYDLVHTLTHEIGHAIGLDHPGARGELMSFRYDEARDGLAAGDIAGAQSLYGAPRTVAADVRLKGLDRTAARP